MSKTDVNLERAYEDECVTYVRYLAFARQAEEEGFQNIAHLFRATAEGETVHALNQLEALEGVKSTEENLRVAIQEEEGDFFAWVFSRYLHCVADSVDWAYIAALSPCLSERQS